MSPSSEATDPDSLDTDVATTATRTRRRPTSVGLIRVVSGATVLAVMVTATWYAEAGRSEVAVTAPVVADRPAALVGPVTSGPVAPATGTATPAAPPKSAAPPKPAAPAAAPAAANAPAAAVAISPGAGVSLPGAAVASPPPSPTAPAAVPGSSVAIGGSASGSAGFAAAPVVEQPPCPGIPKPDKSGGLSSIVELAPMFGSFSSEVFALAPAMQPALQLFGPVLAELEPVIHQNLPWITPILDRVSNATAVVLAAILPFYGPYRDQFIEAEGRFAASLAPVLTRVYQTPAAACLVALEGQIIRNAKSGPIHSPSLTRPGQTLTLRPRS